MDSTLSLKRTLDSKTHSARSCLPPSGHSRNCRTPSPREVYWESQETVKKAGLEQAGVQWQGLEFLSFAQEGGEPPEQLP